MSVTEDAGATDSPPPSPDSDTPRPSAGTDTTTDPPSSAFEDVPEGYYVVNDGKAMVPERAGEGCEGLPSLEPRSNDNEDRVFGYWYSELRDVGPITGATGEAIDNEDGQPVAYVAAPGDTMTAIAARFCIDHYPYLEWINAIRRGEPTSMLDPAGQMPLYAGDTINLDPYTIATVGDENGTVRDNAIDFHIPPQH
ncbi:hypothetical protein [Pseudactinotalea sp. Z1748]|uniref:hypothetical protein n=1 Tax=Pseudactinotalea sp. Z1748 TaxID=3413027 RepID=UPI003C7D03D7